MTKVGIVAIILTALATAIAFALPMPMVPYTQSAGPMLWLGGPMIPGNTGGGGGGGNCIEYQVGGCILYDTNPSHSILVQ